MSSAVDRNFGHIRESGVLLQTKKDSVTKHQRNLILAISVIAALLLVGLPRLIDEILKEKRIRELGKDNPGLTYHMCVNLERYGTMQVQKSGKKKDPEASQKVA